MNGLNTTVLDYDTALKSIPWGDGVTYASGIDKRCNAKGCRRLMGPLVPNDLMAVGYGHAQLPTLQG